MTVFVPDRSAIRAGMQVVSAQVALDLGKRVELTSTRDHVPVDTGALRTSIRTELEFNGGEYYSRVGSRLFYAGWVHHGTGLYGSYGQRIYPRRSRFLRFTLKNGTLIYARSVRGQRPQPYLTRALHDVFD